MKVRSKQDVLAYGASELHEYADRKLLNRYYYTESNSINEKF